jgi:hypothetical protein
VSEPTKILPFRRARALYLAARTSKPFEGYPRFAQAFADPVVAAAQTAFKLMPPVVAKPQ